MVAVVEDWKARCTHQPTRAAAWLSASSRQASIASCPAALESQAVWMQAPDALPMAKARSYSPPLFVLVTAEATQSPILIAASTMGTPLLRSGRTSLTVGSASSATSRPLRAKAMREVRMMPVRLSRQIDASSAPRSALRPCTGSAAALRVSCTRDVAPE